MENLKELTIGLRAEIKNLHMIHEEKKKAVKSAEDEKKEVYKELSSSLRELKELMEDMGESEIVADGMRYKFEDVYGGKISDNHAFNMYLRDAGLFETYAKVHSSTAGMLIRNKLKECKDDNERALLSIPGVETTFYQHLTTKEVKK